MQKNGLLLEMNTYNSELAHFLAIELVEAGFVEEVTKNALEIFLRDYLDRRQEMSYNSSIE
jgi:hypothetical protein